MREFLSGLFAALSVTAAGFYVAALSAAREFFSRKGRPPGGREFLPPVSILKPIYGLEDGTYANLASFCRQDYPDFQILFGVRDGNDPVVETLRRIVRDFSDLDIRIVLCGEANGENPKVSSLVQMEREARHPFLLVSDADIRVGPDYLRRVVQPMRDPEVGAVTCMCHSLSKGRIGTLEALRESTEFCPSVLTAWKLEGGIRFGLGSTILVRREALQRMKGFPAIADYLADDFLLGNRIARAGYRVHLSDVVVEHDLSIRSWKQLFLRQLRWNRGVRASRPWGYRGLVFTYGIPMSLALLFVSGFAPWGWMVLGLTWAIRLITAYWIGDAYLKDRAARRFWIWVPVQDVVSFVLWGIGLFGSSIRWQDRTFRLSQEGKLIPLGAPYSDASNIAAR